MTGFTPDEDDRCESADARLRDEPAALWLPCCVCRRTLVNVGDGFDTCAACEARQ